MGFMMLQTFRSAYGENIPLKSETHPTQPDYCCFDKIHYNKISIVDFVNYWLMIDYYK